MLSAFRLTVIIDHQITPFGNSDHALYSRLYSLELTNGNSDIAVPGSLENYFGGLHQYG